MQAARKDFPEEVERSWELKNDCILVEDNIREEMLQSENPVFQRMRGEWTVCANKEWSFTGLQYAKRRIQQDTVGLVFDASVNSFGHA